MATANARSRGGTVPDASVPPLWRNANPSRQRVDIPIAQVAGHDDDGYRERADGAGHQGNDRPGTFRTRVGGQHQHRDVDVVVDDVEDLLGRIALADHAL